MSKHILRKRTIGYTTVSNSVVNVLKSNLPALGLYLYLLSLPDNWEFHKTHISKTCKIGIKKLERLLKELCAFALVQYGQKRNSKGQFEEFYIDIYDIESIKINELDKSVQPERQNCRTVETDGRFGEAIKETYTKEKEIIKNKHSCASEDAHKHFDEFWKIYPVKKNKKRTKQIWEKKKYDEIAPLILSDIEKRKKIDHQWQNLQFIPHPSTYLNGELWQDDMVPKANGTTQTKFNPLEYALNDVLSEYKPKGNVYDA